jgi:hypothetical protein
MSKYNILQEEENHVSQLMLTGGIVGAISSLIYTPTEYTKIHAQIDKEVKPEGSFSRIFTTLKN